MAELDMQMLQKQYYDVLINGGNLNYLCEITAKECGLPVALALPTRTLIARSADYTQDLINEYIHNLEMCEQEEVKDMFFYVQNQIMTRHAVVDIYPYLTYKHINCGCFIGSTLYAVIDCQVTKKCDMDRAISIVEMSAPVFLTALRINRYVTAEMTCPMQIYLAGLLNRKDESWFQQNNLYKSPIDTIRTWQLFWCFPSQPEQERQRKNKVDHFCNTHRDVWYVEHDNGLVGIFNARQKGLLEDIIQLCSDVTPIGISEPFHELRDVVKQLHDTQTALRMLLFEEREDRVAFAADYKMLIQFLSVRPAAGSLEAEQFVLNQIRKYDETHESEYYKTMRAWLLCSMDYKKMANKLYVHRNTIVYRMQRIQELFGIDLNDCRTITNLYLSIFMDFT
ncbi:MAG: helix-turn-helix domain-containing protein [Clostridiales bacterium]|nr:helix-turn-helix domain-containing protein [Clostridiales bacterium]